MSIKKVTAPNSKIAEYLTPGKTYPVKRIIIQDKDFYFFTIENDEKQDIRCLLTGCAHLLEKDWIISNTEN